ncbi:MAG: hypothetical protein II903_02805 [Spirochaetales bacterium]|nr:hypothetical protein [Spirochaetales bacterium]MBQ3728411.1 hypothetical protein [Spirochaetales bacterium]MBQ6125134.1 hypothetical protein [Spirochaetales bacterium]
MSLKKFCKSLTKVLPDKAYVWLDFIRNLHRIPNLRNPSTFNEKLQWLKLHDHNPGYTQMADKLAMRSYVQEKLGPGHTVQVLGIWNSFDEIEFSSLPDMFVLKCNNDSGHYVICKDKNSFDMDAARKRIMEGLSTNYYYQNREWVYKDIVPRVFAEQYLQQEEGSHLWDYKFFCFNGEPKIMYMEKEASDIRTEAFFDMDKNYLDLEMDDPRPDVPPALPSCFDQMRSMAAILSEGIPFLRVDFFYVNGAIYVGELTFFHCGGLAPVRPERWNRILGSWISLPKGNTD